MRVNQISFLSLFFCLFCYSPVSFSFSPLSPFPPLSIYMYIHKHIYIHSYINTYIHTYICKHMLVRLAPYNGKLPMPQYNRQDPDCDTTIWYYSSHRYGRIQINMGNGLLWLFMVITYTHIYISCILGDARRIRTAGRWLLAVLLLHSWNDTGFNRELRSTLV